MMKLHALIFDLDGTLIDSAADLMLALNGLLAAHGRSTLTLGQVKSMVGDGLRVLLQRAFAATGEPLPDKADPALYDDFLRRYQNQHASPQMLYPLALETLRSYRGQGVKIGLCTNKIYQATIRLLREVGIAELFDAVAGCDSFAVCKPHPGHVLGVAAALSVQPQHCVMIGDSANDILAAQGAGVAAIAIAHGYGQNVEALGADAIIGGFAELPQALRSLGFDIVG